MSTFYDFYQVLINGVEAGEPIRTYLDEKTEYWMNMITDVSGNAAAGEASCDWSLVK